MRKRMIKMHKWGFDINGQYAENRTGLCGKKMQNGLSKKSQVYTRKTRKKGV